MEEGNCLKIAGPFAGLPKSEEDETEDVSDAVQALGGWTARDHILCFLSNDAEVSEASLTISPAKPGAWPIQGSIGEFGFGEKVLVDLRPRIQTSAVWPLQASVPSLGIPFRGQAARLIALRTIVENEMSELPVVTSHSRFGWPIDVQLLNETMGTCQPENIPGAKRMACRLRDGAVGEVQLVVICGLCSSGRAALHVGSGREFTQTALPWIGLSAPVPKQARQWVVTVMDDKERFEFVVAIARGDAQVTWQESTSQRHARLCGWVLAQVTLVAIAATVLACAAAVTGRPAAPLAAAPGLSAGAMALPFLALLAGRQDAPSLLQSGFGPLGIFCASPGAVILGAVVVVAFVIIAHCAAVAQFLAANGPGAAEHMPHGLSFGGWELRSLPYLALPVSAAATTIVKTAWDEGFRFFNVLYGLFGGLVLLFLLVAAWKVRRQLREWFVELRVICLQHPKSGQLQYVDRVCDQLLALPFVPGETRLLGSWSASPGFRFSPTVASIFSVEHTGAAKTRGADAWDRTWSTGPWTDFMARQPSSPQLQKSTSSNSLRHRGISLESGADLLGQTRGTSRKYQAEAAASLLMGAHPIVVRTQFVYAESNNDVSIAGVTGLSWLDAVVPAHTLASIEDCVAHIQLRVQACQLAGPLTSGVLAACFDQCDRTPWRWHQDLMAKVILGSLVSLAPVATAQRMEQAVWLLAVLVVAAWVPWTVPHVHLLDNLSAAAAAVALPLGSGFYFCGHQLLDVDYMLVYATLAAGFFPMILVLAASVLTLSTAFAPRCSEETRDQALQSVVAGWGEISSSRIGSANFGYVNLQEEDDSPGGSSVRIAPSETASVHSADIVLLPPQSTGAEEVKRPKLPCEVRSPIQQTHLWMKGPIAVSSTLGERRPRLGIPAELLLGSPECGAMGLPTACPLATVLTPTSGILLYADKDLNGGIPWQEALQRFLADQPSLLKEAMKALRGLEEKDFEESSCLVSLEILQ